jgi:hypothetical protein
VSIVDLRILLAGASLCGFEVAVSTWRYGGRFERVLDIYKIIKNAKLLKKKALKVVGG